MAETFEKAGVTRTGFELAVVIVRHDEPALMLSGCLESIAGQKDISLEVHLIDHQNESAIEDMVSRLDGGKRHSFSYHAVDTDSISLSRNMGVAFSRCRFVAFTEPDCLPSPDWSKGLLRALDQDGVSAAGSRIELVWMGKPGWLHGTVFVKERFAYFYLGEKVVRTDRLMGGSFSIDRDDLAMEGLFSESLGRDGGRLFGGEETDLCRRILSSGGTVLYTPEGSVRHLIPPQRMNVRELIRRSYYSGATRSKRGGPPRPLHPIKTGADYLAIAFFAPFYAAGYISSRFRLCQSHRAG